MIRGRGAIFGTRGWWTLVVAYVAALFALQPRLGFIVDAAKERWGDAMFARGMLTATVLAGLLFAVLVVRVWRQASATDRGLLLVVAGLYIVGVALLDVPQERLHYVEYGVLAALIHLGCVGSGMSPGRAALVAIVATSALGALDEVLQGAFWERRYFDWRDVQLNIQAAVLGALAGLAVGRASRRDPLRSAPK